MDEAIRPENRLDACKATSRDRSLQFNKGLKGGNLFSSFSEGNYYSSHEGGICRKKAEKETRNVCVCVCTICVCECVVHSEDGKMQRRVRERMRDHCILSSRTDTCTLSSYVGMDSTCQQVLQEGPLTFSKAFM